MNRYVFGPIKTPGGKRKRKLPDPGICRTRPIEDSFAYADCLVDNPIDCPHVIYFCGGYLCKHPNWKDFVQP